VCRYVSNVDDWVVFGESTALLKKSRATDRSIVENVVICWLLPL
jgi:hypothetical protein